MAMVMMLWSELSCEGILYVLIVKCISLLSLFIKHMICRGFYTHHVLSR